MRIIFTILFIAVSVIHLLSCLLGKTRLADNTKPLLMPLLAFVEVSYLLPFLPASQHVMLMLVLALAFGFLGDTMLLGTSNLSFTSGTGSFLISHLFYINLFSQSTLHSRSSLTLIIGGVVCLILALTGYILLGKPKAPIGGGIVIYAFVLFVLNGFTLTALLKKPSPATAAALAGSLLFLLSDSILGYSVFKKDFKNSRFFIMLTYIPAQALLTTGAVLPILHP